MRSQTQPLHQLSTLRLLQVAIQSSLIEVITHDEDKKGPSTGSSALCVSCGCDSVLTYWANTWVPT